MNPDSHTHSPNTHSDPRKTSLPAPIEQFALVYSNGQNHLIARHFIPSESLLFRIEGTLKSHPTRYSLQIKEDLHLDAPATNDHPDTTPLHLWRYLNHSCEPNTRIENQNVIALNDIFPSEMVTFNYLTTEWDMAEGFSCHCGSPRCLGTIRGFRYLTSAQRGELPPVAPHLWRLLNRQTPASA